MIEMNGINPPLLRSTYRATACKLPYIHPLSNSIILLYLQMVEAPEKPSSTDFVTLHKFLIRAFGTLPILLTPSKPLRLSICTTVNLYLSFCFHIIVSPPHIRRSPSDVSCKTLIHSSCKLLVLTRDLISLATVLPLITFLRHSAISVPDSSKTHPKYLNSDTCYNRTITLLLYPWDFRPLLLHTSTK